MKVWCKILIYCITGFNVYFFLKKGGDKLPQNHELPKEIEQVLLLEKTQGYFNCAIVGGFAGWLQTLAERLPQKEKDRLLQLAENYDQAAFLERPLLWQEIWQLLVDIPALIWQPQTAKSSLPLEVQEAEQALHTSIQYLKGVGPKKAALLRRLEIYSICDLLFWLPRTYEVRGEVVPIAEAEPGQMVAIRGKILTNTLIPTSKRLTILKVLLADKTGSINAVWFNQKHLQKQLTAGKYLMVYGKLERKYRQTELWVQDYELLETGLEQSAKILPVYPSTGNLSQKNIRALLAAAWERYSRFLTESLPSAVLAKRQLLSLREALSEIHFPSSLAAAEAGRVRLAYEELLVLQLAILQNRVPETAIGIARPSSEKDLPTFLAELPFPLTNAQRRVIGEVFHDMEREKPMARLVQGDVGSGKTIVAAAALYKNAVAGYQGALMAPTEILAQQHYQTLQPIFTKLGYKIALLTGDTGSKERRELLQQIKFGEIAVVIGTHTLFQKDMEFEMCIRDRFMSF